MKLPHTWEPCKGGLYFIPIFLPCSYPFHTYFPHHPTFVIFFVYIYLHTQPLKTSSFKEEEQSDAMVSNTTRAPRDSTGSGRHASRRAILVGPQEQNLPVSDLRGHHRVEPLPRRQHPAPPACHPQSSTQK